jgi:hypothetical protein
MIRPLIQLTLAVVLALLAVEKVQAEPIAFSYYLFTEDVDLHSVVVSEKVSRVSVGFPGGYGGTGSAVLGATAPLGTVSLTYAGDPPAPQAIFNASAVSSAFFDLTLTDSASGTQDSVRVRGTLSGTLGLDTSSLTMSFPNGPVEMRLGDYLYRVEFPTVALPPWNSNGVEFTPQLTISAAGASEHAPEPSTLALGALAGLGLAARRWLRRRVGTA